jgi:ferredoxin
LAKILRVAFPEKCIGCELCVYEVQRQLKKFGIEDSLIRIFRNLHEGSTYPEFTVELDPKVNSYDIEKIRLSCPKAVFIIEEIADES